MKKYLICLLLSLICSSFAVAQVVYVTPGGTGDGSSWINATSDLQEAINTYDSSEVWVAAGTYTAQYFPAFSSSSDSLDEKCKAFYMRNTVEIYGGFVGTETDRSQRDPKTNVTTLSGGYTQYHVIFNQGYYSPIDTSAVLDGFTISGGNAAFYYTHLNGGGMYNSGASPTIRNCRFYNNKAGATSHPGAGGGMANVNIASPIIENCSFENNSAKSGAALYINDSSSPRIIKCQFLSNTGGTSGEGGAIKINANATSDSKPVIKNCVFKNNSSGDGGAIFTVYSKAKPLILNSVFYKNYAEHRGGAIYTLSSTNEMIIINCSFSENSAQETTGGIHCDVASPKIINTILWNNRQKADNKIRNLSGSPSFSYCCFNESYSGTGMISEDPKFADDMLVLDFGSPCIDAGSSESLYDFYTGDNNDSTDYYGYPRMTGNIDMGAHERQPLSPDDNNIVYVNSEASATDDGSSWEKATNNLHAAIQFMESGEIWVAKGIYYPQDNVLNHVSVSSDHSDSCGYHFQLKENLTVRGGFAGDEPVDFCLAERDFITNETILSGDVGEINDESDNSYHVFYHGRTPLDATAVLDGFTITKGRAKYGSSHDDGGGMYNGGYDNEASPTIMNCNFTDNKADYYGGAMYNYQSMAMVVNCTFTNNEDHEIYGGGAVFNKALETGTKSPSFIGCTFESNNPHGMKNDFAPVQIEQCVFESNSEHGILNEGFTYGGADTFYCEPVINRSIFQNNGGSGVFNDHYVNSVATNSAFIENKWGGFVNRPNLRNSSKVVNCTFYLNKGYLGYGGGFYAYDESHVIANCIFWKNLDSDNVYHQISTPTPELVTNCCIHNGTSTDFPGEGNIFDDPLFVSTDSWSSGFRLKEASPCIDVGSDVAYDNVCSDTLDAAGNPRKNGVIDIGAYEYTVISAINQNSVKVASDFELKAAYPNPFNPTTTIQYSIPKATNVTLTIYNMNGQVVEKLVNQKQEAGFYSVNWDARNVSTGIYFYRIQTDGFQQVKKCVLVK